MEETSYINLYQNNDSTATDRIPAECSTVRDFVFLDKPSDYNVAIVRFNIPTDGIPLFIFKDNYYVTLSYGGDNYTNLLTLTPDPSDHVTNEVFEIQFLIESINNGFQLSYNQLIADHPAVIASPPFFMYDPVTHIISMRVVKDYAIGYPNNTISIWMNNPLYKKVEGFFVFTNHYNNADKKDVKFYVKDLGNNEYESIYYLMQQEFANNSYLDLVSLVLTTSLLPIQNEQIVISNNGQTQGGSQSLSIVTDFYPNITPSTTTIAERSYIYNANIYRWAPLQSNYPLRSIDIKVYWQDASGTLYPVYLTPGKGFSIKLKFLKKGLAS